MDQIKFDNPLHNPSRYAIVAILAHAGGQASFMAVLGKMGLKHSGMLSQHSRKLEAVGYLQIIKTFADRRPHTTLLLTARGQRAFSEHMRVLNAIAEPPMMERTG